MAIKSRYLVGFLSMPRCVKVRNVVGPDPNDTKFHKGNSQVETVWQFDPEEVRLALGASDSG